MTRERRDAWRWLGWKVLGLAGVASVAAAVVTAAQSPPVPAPPLHLMDYLGLTGVVAVAGWAVQWGRHEEFKKSTIARLQGIDVAFLRTERWEDHREVLDRQHAELLDRIDKLHSSLQTIRRDQLERLHGMTEKEGGV